MTPQENKVIQANKFKVLTYLGKPVDENLLSNGIYHTQKPILHDYSETIGMIIDRGKKLLDCQGRCFVPDSYFDNLEKCELTDFILTALDTEPKVNQELDNLLLSVCQLIMGWNATENEWSEWDQKVYNEVVAMRLKMNPQLAKELNDAANSELPKFISEMSKVTPEQRQERYMMKEQSQPVPDKTVDAAIEYLKDRNYNQFVDPMELDMFACDVAKFSDQNTAPLLARIRELEGENKELKNYIRF